MGRRLRTQGITVAAIAAMLGASVVAAPAAEANDWFWPRQKKVIYLTFDDGPSPYTQPVMNVLRRYNARATFFMLGQNAATNRSLINAVRWSGHAIGNHTYTHPNMTTITPAEMVTEMKRTDNVIGRTTCMRPPFQAFNQSVYDTVTAERKSMEIADIDSSDWSEPGVQQIIDNVMPNVRDGGVILFHDGGGNRQQTVDALGTILNQLSRDGYRFERLPECR